MSIFTPKAEMLHFIVEVQTRAAGLEATFLAAPAHSRRLKESNAAAAADSFKGRQHTAGHSNDYLNTACTQESLMEVCS